ncbi:MAG: phosphatase PAP2 family protein, partial [Alistipes sp.]|nr:phosphatase PAP2 family protein [Alistipes sp.]
TFLSIICSVLSGLVLISRLYLGVHTPWDVFTSLAVCVLTIIIIKHFGQNYIFPRTNKIAMLMIAILYSAGLCLYSYILVRWQVSTVELVADSVIFAATLTGFSIGIYIENRFIGFRTQCFSFFMQIIKAVLGLGGLLLISYGCSYLPFHRIYADSLKGFLVCIWATCIFPVFIKCVQKKNYSEL